MYLVVGKLIYKNLRNDNLKYIIAWCNDDFIKDSWKM
jgi:hypothetical protein